MEMAGPDAPRQPLRLRQYLQQQQRTVSEKDVRVTLCLEEERHWVRESGNDCAPVHTSPHSEGHNPPWQSMPQQHGPAQSDANVNRQQIVISPFQSLSQISVVKGQHLIFIRVGSALQQDLVLVKLLINRLTYSSGPASLLTSQQDPEQTARAAAGAL